MHKLLAFLPGVSEPEIVQPDPTGDFAVAFADPATVPGGTVNLVLSGSPKPASLTVVYVATGLFGGDQVTYENLAHPDHSIGTEYLDAASDATAISITVSPVPSPGVYDVAVFGSFAE